MNPRWAKCFSNFCSYFVHCTHVWSVGILCFGLTMPEIVATPREGVTTSVIKCILPKGKQWACISIMFMTATLSFCLLYRHKYSQISRKNIRKYQQNKYSIRKWLKTVYLMLTNLSVSPSPSPVPPPDGACSEAVQIHKSICPLPCKLARCCCCKTGRGPVKFIGV